MLVRRCWPVCYALRHRVGLGPDHVRPQIPAIGTEREGDLPGNAEEVLGLHALWRRWTIFARSLGPAIRHAGEDAALMECIAHRSWRGRTVTIPQVQPQHAIVPQHAADFPEYSNHLGHESIRRRFKANLSRNAIVTEAIVGRRRNAALNDSRRQRCQHLATIPVEYTYHPTLHAAPASSSESTSRAPRRRVMAETTAEHG